ncbi:TPA: aminoglycoside adenylyltransferase domain-containing protein, partial [Escherichia coli]
WPLRSARITLMNPLMILVKIIKLRWIHILSYDQMVSRKINNQTTRCANSIFYTTLFTNSAPKEHFSKALFDTIAQWNAESDWKGDERNVVLALARIWYSASTGLIAPKDVAAAWVSERLPAEHRPLICKARAAYLGSEDDDLAMRVEETAAFVRYAKATIERILR